MTIHTGASRPGKGARSSSAASVWLAAMLSALVAGPALGGEGKRPKFDLNGDGVVTIEEVAQRRQQMFAYADLNGDGYLTRAEIEEARAQRREQQTGSRADRFDRADRDGDGKISLEESQANAELMASRLDRNGDGEVSRGEFRDAMAAMRKHQPGLSGRD